MKIDKQIDTHACLQKKKRLTISTLFNRLMLNCKEVILIVTSLFKWSIVSLVNRCGSSDGAEMNDVLDS